MDPDKLALRSGLCKECPCSCEGLQGGPLVYVLGSLLVGTVLLTIVLISVLVFQENRKTRRCETTRNSSSSTSSNSEMPGVCIERRPRPLYLTLLPPEEMGVSPESETFLCTSNAARCEDSDSASSEQQNKQPDLVAPLAEGTLTTPEQVYKVQELAACPSMQLSEGRNLKAIVHAKDYQSLGPTDATEYTSPYKLKPKEESSAEKPRFHRSYQVNYEGMDKATIFTKTQYTTYRV